jgi:hypothetical protein
LIGFTFHGISRRVMRGEDVHARRRQVRPLWCRVSEGYQSLLVAKCLVGWGPHGGYLDRWRVGPRRTLWPLGVRLLITRALLLTSSNGATGRRTAGPPCSPARNHGPSVCERERERDFRRNSPLPSFPWRRILTANLACKSKITGCAFDMASWPRTGGRSCLCTELV